ncbi:MAG: SGNH/GDSL hydrolase family protein [Candidatus Geothermincolia bacterium]
MTSQMSSISSITWKNLEGKRIFFGHQSVGSNIVDGIKDLEQGSGMKAPLIVELAEAAAPKAPAFAHVMIGRNTDPGMKITDFTERIEKGIGAWADIAILKFCYVDITADTDVASLFDEYQRAIERLRNDFPALVFVHVTVPLTTVEAGPGAWIRKLLGKTLRRYENNRQRDRYNEFIRRGYAGKEPIFDLARIEATSPDGSSSLHEYAGHTVPALSPLYTNDGGHLSEVGRRVVAAELLTFLGQLNH